MKLHHTGKLHCPACKQLCDTHASGSPGEDRAPQDGDPTLCGYCYAVLRFTDGAKRLKVLTEDEFEALDPFTRHELITVAALLQQRSRMQ
jgi:hypothetical protein